MNLSHRPSWPALAIAMLAQLASIANAQDALLSRAVHRQAAAALKAVPDLERNPYTVLVRFKPEVTEIAKAQARAAASAERIRTYRLVPGLELVYARRGPEATVQSLQKWPCVQYAELDTVVHIDQGQRFPVDPTFFPFCWGMHNEGTPYNFQLPTAGADVNAPEAWYVNIGNPNFIVAIIDTGIQWTHPNLNDNIWANTSEANGLPGIDDDHNGYVDDVRGWDFSADDSDPMDENGHGTHVAGTVGAEEGGPEQYLGVVGMMWRCKLMPLRFLDVNGSGFMSDAALALEYAVAKGVKVSNNSYGYSTGGVNHSLYDAIDASKSIGHIFVAAAGNGGSDGIGDDNDGNRQHYPSSFNLDNIIAVAATDMNDQRADFSNYGRTTVDLAAPGVYILSTYLLNWGGPGYTQRFLDGTSMAAPHVAGTAGLVYCQNPGWTYQQVRSRIISSARPVPALANITVSGGVLDAAGALGVSVPPPPAHPPAVPGTPVVASLGGGVVQIKWQDKSNDEDGFAVQRERKTDLGWDDRYIIANLSANVTVITDTPGRGVYRYHVLSRKSGIASAWSEWAEIKN